MLAGQMLVRPGGKVRLDSNTPVATPSKAENNASGAKGGHS
jgi:hypothetical protein